MSDDQVKLLERRLKREKSSRQQAEHFLETKSLELYETNLKLQELADSREEQIRERTKELEITRDKALSASRAKTNFLASMSHEIRTPMNGVIGMAQILLDTELTPSQRKQLTILRSSSESLLHIINDILDLSKLESGKFEIHNKTFHLCKLIEEVLGSLAIPCSEKKVELLNFVDTGIPYEIYGDPIRLRQILINLLGNAIKFTEKGNVQLNLNLTKKSDDSLSILFEVIDTGMGISKDGQKKLFKHFSQVKNYSHDKHVQQGTGLGLSISKNLTELMGGEIGVESKLNKGSNFWVEIPFKSTHDIRARKPLDKHLAFYQPDSDIRDIMSFQLKSICKNVTVLDDVQDLIKLSLDLNNMMDHILVGTEYMNDTDYSSLLKHLKSDDVKPEQWIFIQSLNESRSEINEYSENNQTRTILKPLSQLRLIEALSDEVVEEKAVEVVKSETTDKSKTKILLAEDNKVNQMVAKAILAKEGYEVTVAEDGLLAIEAYKNGNFDLVLMDINMPNMGGLEATKHLKQIMFENDSETPIIALTANAMDGAEKEYLSHGMDGYLTKPIEIPALKKELEKWLTLA